MSAACNLELGYVPTGSESERFRHSLGQILLGHVMALLLLTVVSVDLTDVDSRCATGQQIPNRRDCLRRSLVGGVDHPSLQRAQPVQLLVQRSDRFRSGPARSGSRAGAFQRRSELRA